MSVDQDVRLIALVLDAGNIVQRVLDKRLLRVGLGLAQYRLLAALVLADDRLTPSALSALLLQEPHSLSGLLNRMEDRGLVIRRRQGRTDRRVVRVGVTAEGRALAKRASEIVAETVVQMLGNVPKAFADRTAPFLNDLLAGGVQLAGVDLLKREETLRTVGARNAFLTG